MRVEYSKAFVKVVKKLSGKMLDSVRAAIQEVIDAQSVDQITDCKKLIDFDYVYRIRKGMVKIFPDDSHEDLDRMEELGLTQKKLAERMGCSQQYVSKVLRGKENLSLETLCKIENALELHIVQEPEMVV